MALPLILNDLQTLEDRKPGHFIIFDLSTNVRLHTIHIRRSLVLKINDEVNIVPNIVILLPMELEALLRITINLDKIETTDETDVLLIIVIVTLHLSQHSERINNDTKDNVEQNDDDNQEERKVEEESDRECDGIIASTSLCREKLTNTTTCPQSVVER